MPFLKGKDKMVTPFVDFEIDTTHSLNQLITKTNTTSSLCKVKITQDLLLEGRWYKPSSTSYYGIITSLEIPAQEISNITYSSSETTLFRAYRYDLFNSNKIYNALDLKITSNYIYLNVNNGQGTVYEVYKCDWSGNVTTDRRGYSTSMMLPTGEMYQYVLYLKKS